MNHELLVLSVLLVLAARGPDSQDAAIPGFRPGDLVRIQLAVPDVAAIPVSQLKTPVPDEPILRLVHSLEPVVKAAVRLWEAVVLNVVHRMESTLIRVMSPPLRFLYVLQVR